VPRWATITAYAVPLAVLPSALWRLPVVFGYSMGTLEDGEPFQPHGAEAVYIVSLSLVLEGIALLTLGLVKPGASVFRIGSRSSAGGQSHRGSSSGLRERARCFWG
jgi:hypothetical protein